MFTALYCNGLLAAGILLLPFLHFYLCVFVTSVTTSIIYVLCGAALLFMRLQRKERKSENTSA